MKASGKALPLGLVCNQRAGSTALHSALKHTGCIDAYGEIFHPDGVKTKCNFYQFLKETRICNCPLTPVSDAKQLGLQYVEYCSENCNEGYYLLDVKYDAWHVLQGPWLNRHEPPLLIYVLDQCGALFADFFEVQAAVSRAETPDYKNQRLLHWLDEAAFFQVTMVRDECFFGGSFDMQMRAAF